MTSPLGAIYPGGNLTVPLVGGVLIAQRSLLRCMSEPAHDLRGAGAGGGGQRPRNMALVVQVEIAERPT